MEGIGKQFSSRLQHPANGKSIKKEKVKKTTLKNKILCAGSGEKDSHFLAPAPWSLENLLTLAINKATTVAIKLPMLYSKCNQKT